MSVTTEHCNMQISCRLQSALIRLSTEEVPGTLAAVEDDTALQKLHSHIHNIISKANVGLPWLKESGLVSFVQLTVDPKILGNPKNLATGAFGIKVLASMFLQEDIFKHYLEDKVLCNLVFALPCIRAESSLSSAMLILVQNTISHSSGREWIIKNGIWEKILLPCLRSPSLFVHRHGGLVITKLLLLIIDTTVFKTMVQDLLMISDKFCELKKHVNIEQREELCQGSLFVFNVFQQMFIQTLGREPIYSKINNVVDIDAWLVNTLKCNIPEDSVNQIADIFMLNLIHKFQEKVLHYGILEQHLVDSLCSDIISLARILMERESAEAFLRSSVNMHKYWRIMSDNMKERRNIDLDKADSILYILSSFQMVPIKALYTARLEEMYKTCPEKREWVQKYNDDLYNAMRIKEERKVEAWKLEEDLKSYLEKNPNNTAHIAGVCISSIIGVIDYFYLTSAVIAFQGMVFLLMSVAVESAPMRHNNKLQKTVIDGLGILVEKFNIDWRKSKLAVCIMGILCDMILVPGITTQVKVCTLKAMNSCIQRFIPPVMSMLVDSGKLESNSLEVMGQVLSVYLVDVEWEVRDSALELIISCMKLAKEKYPYFVDWLLRYKLLTAVLLALDDVEGYVRASAISVLTNIVSIDKIWVELEGSCVPHRALAMVVREGETPVRLAAINFVKALFSAGRFTDEDVSTIVVPVTEGAMEDPDDEIRMAALGFALIHLQQRLTISGMVDGEYPSVTFSSGKIVNLTKSEIQARIIIIFTWFCECGYFFSILSAVKDPVESVRDKGCEILSFVNSLAKRYEISECQFSNSESEKKAFSKTESNVPVKTQEGAVIVTIAGLNVNLPKEEHLLKHIDSTIEDILKISTVAKVTSIKRPVLDHMDEDLHSSWTLSLADLPTHSPAIPLECLLKKIDELCINVKHGTTDDETGELLGLLDDILLDGRPFCPDQDDQRLRDCY